MSRQSAGLRCPHHPQMETKTGSTGLALLEMTAHTFVNSSKKGMPPCSGVGRSNFKIGPAQPVSARRTTGLESDYRLRVDMAQRGRWYLNFEI